MNTHDFQKTIIQKTEVNKSIEIHTHTKIPIPKKPTKEEKELEDLFDEDDIFDESDIEVRNILLKIRTPGQKYRIVGEQSVVNTSLFNQSNVPHHKRSSFH